MAHRPDPFLRRGALIVLLPLLAVVLGTTPAPADEQKAPPPIDREAALVARLLRPAGDGAPAQPTDAAIEAALADEDLDPWLLVEHALVDGRADVARRFAAGVDQDQVGPLVAYATGAVVSGVFTARRDALREAAAHHAAGRVQDALRRLEALAAEPVASVLHVRARELRGEWIQGRLDPGEVMEAWLATAEAALRLGCWQRAQVLFHQALMGAYAAGSYELATAAGEGLRTLVELRDPPEALGDAEYDLAAVARLRGDLPRAIRHLTEAMHIYETLGLAEQLAAARSLHSFCLAEVGEFSAAIDEQDRLARYFRDREHDEAWLQNHSVLGIIRYRLGDEAGAMRVHTEVLEQAQALGNDAAVARAHGNLGLVHMQGGRWEEAIAAYRKALAGLDAEESPFSAANAKLNLAFALKARAEAAGRELAELEDEAARAARRTAQGQGLASARSLLAEVQATAEAVSADHLALLARLSSAEILLAENKAEDAFEALTAVRDEAARLRAWHPRVRANVRIAQACLLRGKPATALREARTAAEELARSHAGLSSMDLARARAVQPDVYDIGFTAAMQLGQTDDALWFLEAGRSAALLRGLGGRAAALRAAVPVEIEQRLGTLTRARLLAFTRLRRAQGLGALPRIRDAREVYETRRAAEEEVVEEIHRVQARAARRLVPPIAASTRRLQSRLRRMSRGSLPHVALFVNMQSHAVHTLVVEATGARAVTLEGTDRDALAAALDSLARAEDGTVSPGALATVKRLFVDRLGLPAGAIRLLLSPDRALAFAPLSAALPDDWEITWIPSATTLAMLSERKARTPGPILGLGDPDYRRVRNADILVSRGGPRLVPLPASKEEIEAIAGSPGDVRLLAGEATEAGLARAMAGPDGKPARWSSIHFACHGLVDPERPAFCCLAITPGKGEDGLLTASEILRLKTETSLAVLSACRTGRGTYVRGEGVLGLMRAFMYAGAPRVLVSLWDVEDRATAHLMKVFYREWKAGRSTSTALRRAQLAVRDHEVQETVREQGKPDRQVKRRPWTDPRYWAAWTLWGLPN